MGARGPRMKLKGLNTDQRVPTQIKDEVEGLQHWCGDAASRGHEEGSRSVKRRNEPWYFVVF